jgi:hypothetical protein
VTQARTVAIEIQAERAMAEAMAAGMDVAAMAGAVR